MEGAHADLAAAIGHSKSMLAHSYMSSLVDMTTIAQQFSDTPVDAFVIRAAAKAFKTVSSEPLNVSRVFTHGRTMTYLGVQDLRVGQIAASGLENGATPSDQPLIQVYQVDDSVESLPISVDSCMLSLHFSPPTRQV